MGAPAAAMDDEVAQRALFGSFAGSPRSDVETRAIIR
jgi:hypothetical protein